ncbi:c6 zinc finger domain containing protein [Rutstroemia sp. NJR-2017a BBW]|nr:c6 zinc finger domain containing protein [Rutstroemia sp. NJR-2017a BBW]
MQSPTHQLDQSNISLGERRGKSDLARFSLDLSWARAVADGSQPWAYPSPPMSGSPPVPPRHNPDAGDRVHGSYGSTGNVFRGGRMPQSEQFDQMRGIPLRTYQQEPHAQLTYPQYQMEDVQGQYQYQQPRTQMASQQHHLYAPQPASAPYPAAERQPLGEMPGYTSPKSQRKTKGHVASACVPCKRAHLRCDAQRPCSRCLSNGKEDTCVDVQHKKRGRPRLRDEREPRYEGSGPNYTPPVDSMRRPLTMFSAGDAPVSTPFSELQRTNSGYRVLKSQGGGSMSHGMIPAPVNTNIYSDTMSMNPRMTYNEPACAFLTMEMQIAKTTQAFSGVVGALSVLGRKLHDLVSAPDRDKIFRLQRGFEDERRGRDPSYLPPIFSKEEEDRVISSLSFAPNEIGQLRTDRPEVFTFQNTDGQQRSFHVQLGLAKKDSIYFILLVVHIPTTPQAYQQSSSSPYSRDSVSHESAYGYQTPGQVYASQTPGTSPFMSNPTFGDVRGDMMGYRPQGQLVQNVAGYSQAQPRQEYAQNQMAQPMMMDNPSMQSRPQSAQRSSDLQLPPIRGQRSDVQADAARQRDDRSGRVDIGGLLENPDASRRRK